MEGSVAGDDLTARAPGEATLEIGVELAQPFGEPGGRLSPTENVGDPAGLLRVTERVEPEVGVDSLLAGQKVQALEKVDRLSVRALDGALEAGLEP
jgi:hypothetical protein